MATRTDVSVAMSDPAKRAQIEARRGIARDNEGRIIRSKEWQRARKAHLIVKKADLQQRIKNIDAEVKGLAKSE